VFTRGYSTLQWNDLPVIKIEHNLDDHISIWNVFSMLGNTHILSKFSFSLPCPLLKDDQTPTLQTSIYDLHEGSKKYLNLMIAQSSSCFAMRRGPQVLFSCFFFPQREYICTLLYQYLRTLLTLPTFGPYPSYALGTTNNPTQQS